jgi:hypothetical protein
MTRFTSMLSIVLTLVCGSVTLGAALDFGSTAATAVTLSA